MIKVYEVGDTQMAFMHNNIAYLLTWDSHLTYLQNIANISTYFVESVGPKFSWNFTPLLASELRAVLLCHRVAIDRMRQLRRHNVVNLDTFQLAAHSPLKTLHEWFGDSVHHVIIFANKFGSCSLKPIIHLWFQLLGISREERLSVLYKTCICSSCMR